MSPSTRPDSEARATASLLRRTRSNWPSPERSASAIAGKFTNTETEHCWPAKKMKPEANVAEQSTDAAESELHGRSYRTALSSRRKFGKPFASDLGSGHLAYRFQSCMCASACRVLGEVRLNLAADPQARSGKSPSQHRQIAEPQPKPRSKDLPTRFHLKIPLPELLA